MRLSFYIKQFLFTLPPDLFGSSSLPDLFSSSSSTSYCRCLPLPSTTGIPSSSLPTIIWNDQPQVCNLARNSQITFFLHRCLHKYLRPEVCSSPSHCQAWAFSGTAHATGTEPAFIHSPCPVPCPASALAFSPYQWNGPRSPTSSPPQTISSLCRHQKTSTHLNHWIPAPAHATYMYTATYWYRKYSKGLEVSSLSRTQTSENIPKSKLLGKIQTFRGRAKFSARNIKIHK